MYRCPVCAAPLVADSRSYRCGAGHTFDIAREGYVNLLAGRSARRRAGGDDAEMVRARRLFLDAGHYEQLRDAVVERVQSGSVLDLGCGEGYYSRPLADAREEWIGGIDLSSAAIRLAARRSQSINYAVANAFAIPIDDNRIDVIVNVFGPVAPTEIVRVLSPSAAVVSAAPGPSHLIELKSLVLDRVEEHELSGPRGLEAEFTMVDQDRLTYEITVEQPELDALLTMTPYRWRTTADRRDHVSSLEKLTVTADFLIHTYRTRP